MNSVATSSRFCEGVYERWECWKGLVDEGLKEWCRLELLDVGEWLLLMLEAFNAFCWLSNSYEVEKGKWNFSTGYPPQLEALRHKLGNTDLEDEPEDTDWLPREDDDWCLWVIDLLVDYLSRYKTYRRPVNRLPYIGPYIYLVMIYNSLICQRSSNIAQIMEDKASYSRTQGRRYTLESFFSTKLSQSWKHIIETHLISKIFEDVEHLARGSIWRNIRIELHE